MSAYKGNTQKLKGWLTVTEKKQLIYELSEVETVLSYDATGAGLRVRGDT